MAVSRRCRDEVAEVLASFLRGEMSPHALQEILERIRAELGDGKDQDLFLEYLLHFDTVANGHVYCEQDWEESRRTLAFLKSDLEQSSVSFLPPKNEWFDVRFVRLHALCLVLAFAGSFVFSWWLLAVVWIVSFVTGWIPVQIRFAVQGRVEEIERSRIRGHLPFATEIDWRAHETLLVPFNLPHCKDFLRSQRSRSPVTFWVRHTLEPLFFNALILGGLVYLELGALLMWPLWVVLFSLTKC